MSLELCICVYLHLHLYTYINLCVFVGACACVHSLFFILNATSLWQGTLQLCMHLAVNSPRSARETQLHLSLAQPRTGRLV